MTAELMIEVRNLIARYGDRTVLDGISADVHQGEICVVLGSSGCGKTTLLKHLIGLLTPAAGTIRVLGQTIGDHDHPATWELLKRIGVLFQNGALLGSLSVAQNVALPLEMHTDLPAEVIDEIVRLKLAQVRMGHAYALFPGELSGGMRKRAALARALALDPPLLFCDEPSAGLDPQTSRGLDELLVDIRDTLGVTIVVITHELASIERIADRILFLHKGALLFDGSHAAARAVETGPLRDFFDRREEHLPTGGAAALSFHTENVR